MDFRKRLLKKSEVVEEQNLYSYVEFNEYYNSVITQRELYENYLAKKCWLSKKQHLYLKGKCKVCGKTTRFKLDFMYSDGKTPNFRERLSCSICSLNNRQRYIVSYLQEEYKNNKKIYMYEQVTAVYNAVKIFAQDNLIGSEFINRNLKSGSVYDGILHENAEYLSFGDEKFDIIVSNDVFEHVNDVQKCFNEAHRVLKTNGKLIMSVPFYPDKDKTIRRAEIINNEIVYYTDAIYHGNPMSEDGSLVFFDFGWDILHMIKMAGFKEAYVKAYYSKEYGYLGRIPLVFEAIKS